MDAISESSDELPTESLAVPELINEVINNSLLELGQDSKSEGELDSELLDEQVDPEEVTNSKSSSESRPNSLIHTVLAKRLNESTSTLSKWKHREIFPDWSKERDPEHIAWRWDAKTKVFVPIDE